MAYVIRYLRQVGQHESLYPVNSDGGGSEAPCTMRSAGTVRALDLLIWNILQYTMKPPGRLLGGKALDQRCRVTHG
jgi:hypothetical protein